MSVTTKEEREALASFSEKWGPLFGDHSSSARISVNAGGMGVWIAATACLVMLFSLLIGGVIGAFWLSREFDRVDKELNERKEEGQRMQSYLSAIYIQAPQLQPKDEKQDADR